VDICKYFLVRHLRNGKTVIALFPVVHTD